MSEREKDFIAFLQREFSVIPQNEPIKKAQTVNPHANYSTDSRIKNNKKVCTKTKLEKVLDVFIDEAKDGDGRIIDDELIEKWQQSSRQQKKEILSAFVKRHKNSKQKIDLSEIAAVEINRQPVNFINVFVISAVLFAFFLTSLIALTNPALINAIEKGERVAINYILGNKVELENTVAIKEVDKKELGEYIRTNQKTLRTPLHRDKKVFDVPASEVKGRVAGVYEPYYEEIIKEMEKEETKASLLDRAGELMNKLADKQITLSLKLSKKIQEILK